VCEDAHIFYYLETWIASPSDPSTTLYLSQMELFQRQITTAAFKIAGGIDLSSSMSSTKPTKQNAVAPLFSSKITKAFLDVLYAFLDGLVFLASEESPVATGKRAVVADSAIITGTNPLDLLDLTDTVSWESTVKPYY
jgi:exocyst complex component 2